MTRKLSFLVPAFMKRLDQQLLLNHPAIWVTKIHYVLFYALIAFAGISFAVWPAHPAHLPDPESHFWLSMIPAGLGLLFWAWQVGKTNVEKFYGETSFLQRLKLQGLYALCIGIFVSLPFLYGNVIGQKVYTSVPNDQLVEDINDFHVVADELGFNQHYYWNFDGEERLLSERDRKKKRRKRCNNNREVLVAEFTEVMNKYSDQKLSAEDQFGILNSLNGPYNSYSLDQHQAASRQVNEVYYTLQEHAQNKHHWERYDFEFQEFAGMGPYTVFDHSEEKWVATLLLGFYGWIFLMLFMRQGGRRFWLSVVLGLATLLVSGILVATVSSVSHYSFHEENMIAFMYFAGIALCAFLGFMPSSRRKLAFWQSAGTAILTAFLPILPLILYMSADALNGDTSPFEVFGWGILITFFLWNLILDKQFIKLQADPTTD
ncbi:MAG: hypothetical protein AAF399_03280 [Bacteroidota bacterium]